MRSLGLAVDVSWNAVAGADEYEVFHADESDVPLGNRRFVGATTATRLADEAATLGERGFYWVRAVAASGVDGALSEPVQVSAPGDLVQNLDRSITWLYRQQEAAQGFRVRFDQEYSDGYTGRLAGRVDGVEQLAGGRDALPYVAFSNAYSTGYVGVVEGVWRNVADASAYRVDVYSVTDAEYLQGSFALAADGSWTSGETIVGAGEKVAKLVRRADGLVVAVSGQPETALSEVAVDIFSRTDVDYLQQRVPLGSDGRFYTSVNVAPGRKIARLINLTTGRALNSTEWSDSASYQGLVRSFTIPQDDPDYGYTPGTRAGYRLEQRSFIYDNALAVLAYLRRGQTVRARAVLAQLAALQASDGSLDFSYDTFLGRVADPYRRTGAIAWVGYAATQYERETRDGEFSMFTRRLAEYVLGRQVTTANGYAPTDPRYGSVLGGRGRYATDGSYDYVDEPIVWASTEHNIDAFFFFRDFAEIADDDRYAHAADLIRESLLTHHWDTGQRRFYQGVGPAGPDAGRTLDLVSWGGLFLLAVGERARARDALDDLAEFRVDGLEVTITADPDAYNRTYSSSGPIGGYMPYVDSPGYDNPPRTAWTEGTLGALLFRLRMGEDITDDLRSLQRLQDTDPDGGLLQVTAGARRMPWEFHVWPAAAAAAWHVLLLEDSSVLWAPGPSRTGDDAVGGDLQLPATRASEANVLLRPEDAVGLVQQAAPNALYGIDERGPATARGEPWQQSIVAVRDVAAEGFALGSGPQRLDARPLAVAEGADGIVAADSTTVYANAWHATDLAVRPRSADVGTAIQIRARSAPDSFAWEFADSVRSRLAIGGAVLLGRSGAEIGRVGGAVGRDADGRPIPVAIRARGDRISLDVGHRNLAVRYPVVVAASWHQAQPVSTLRADPTAGLASQFPDCDGHYEDQRPFVLDIDTFTARNGPSVRWSVRLTNEHVSILAGRGYAALSAGGRNWVQSSRTYRLVAQGGPSKRFIPLDYVLHSSIYRVHGVGYRYLRWNDYIQVYSRWRGRTARERFYGDTSFACDVRRP